MLSPGSPEGGHAHGHKVGARTLRTGDSRMSCHCEHPSGRPLRAPSLPQPPVHLHLCSVTSRLRAQDGLWSGSRLSLLGSPPVAAGADSLLVVVAEWRSPCGGGTLWPCIRLLRTLPVSALSFGDGGQGCGSAAVQAGRTLFRGPGWMPRMRFLDQWQLRV